MVGIAGNFLGIPIGVVGADRAVGGGAPATRCWLIVVTQALDPGALSAFVTPFTAAVTSLQYLDQRMRKEAYDVELMQQAGITASVMLAPGPPLDPSGYERRRPAARASCCTRSTTSRTCSSR